MTQPLPRISGSNGNRKKRRPNPITLIGLPKPLRTIPPKRFEGLSFDGIVEGYVTAYLSSEEHLRPSGGMVIIRFDEIHGSGIYKVKEVATKN